jgi:succinoglycan biosynthesis protein ExoA
MAIFQLRNDIQISYLAVPANKGQSAERIELPFVTIIMPVRNEEQYIVESLTAVLAQDYSHYRMEVLIADGMSNDRTRELIKKVSEDIKIPVLVIDNIKQIVPVAMNLAIRQARGTIILRVDGHAIIRPDYLSRCVKYLMYNDVDCVGGPVDSVGFGYIGEAVALAMSSRFGVGGTVFRIASNNDTPVMTETVPFGVYRKDVFEKVGFFNEEMVRHQDYEFCYRLRKKGGTIMLLPTARAEYFVRSTFRSFCRQYWQYGIWKGRFVKKNPDALKLRHMVPPVLVLVLLLNGLLSFFFEAAFWLFGATMGAYIAFVMGALISFSMNRKMKYLPILAILLPSMHFSWGVGFWKGLFIKKLS